MPDKSLTAKTVLNIDPIAFHEVVIFNTCNVCAMHDCILKICPFHSRPNKICVYERCKLKICSLKISIEKICSLKMCSSEVCISEVCPGEIFLFKNHKFKVRTYIWIVLAPLIPDLNIILQYCQVL